MRRSFIEHAVPTAFALLLCAAVAFAAEPQKEILDSLRAKGDFNGAIEYLEHVRSNPGLPKSFAETIDYELALGHIDAAQQAAAGGREKHFQLAQEALKKFLAERSDHPLAAEVQSQLANVLFERGRLNRGLGDEREGDRRQKLMAAARDFLAQSDADWAAVDATTDAELKKIVFKTGEDVKRSELREELHSRQIRARLARAWVEYEKALTFEAASSERAAALQEAGRRFDTLADQERERLAGYYARLGRGLCSRETGDMEKAFAVFEELLSDLPDQPADFHALRGKAAVQALEIALRPEVRKYKQGLDIAQRWIAGEAAAPSEVDRAIRFLGAEAAREYVHSLPPPSPEQAAIRSRQIDWIRQQYTAVAAEAGPYRARAKVRLLDPALGAAPVAEPNSFAEAKNRAKAALDRLTAAEAEQKADQRSGASGDADALHQRQQQIAVARSESLKYCDEALKKRTPATPQDDYDAVRYYRAFVQYDAGELDAAATEGEAMAESPGDSLAARQAARIGLAAREALFYAAPADSRAAAQARLQALAEKIVARSGSFPEADDARGILLDLALADGKSDKAEEYLGQIADASPRRGEAELSMGQALWSHAQHLERISTVDHDRMGESEKLADRAATLLGDGIARSRKQIEAGAVAPLGLDDALLAMAEVELARGRAAEAIALLEERSAAAASTESYSLEILAYVSAGQMDKARSCLQTLQAALPPRGNREGARQIIAASARFERLVERHLTHLRNRRMDQALNDIVVRCDAFLAAPAEGPTAGSFFVLAFRAEGYAGVAAGLDSGGPAVPSSAEKGYRRAIAAFEEVLHRAADDPAFSPAAEAVIALRIDLARCLRRMSDFPRALTQVLDVLESHPLMVDAQVEVAYIYQAWGEDQPEYLDLAIQGDPRHTEVWGWGELARRVESEARFRGVFHEARYHLAYCRFRQAQAASRWPERTRLATEAENDILATRRLFADMGGEVWYDRYDDLLKRIQRLADQPAVGLSSATK